MSPSPLHSPRPDSTLGGEIARAPSPPPSPGDGTSFPGQIPIPGPGPTPGPTLSPQPHSPNLRKPNWVTGWRLGVSGRGVGRAEWAPVHPEVGGEPKSTLAGGQSYSYPHPQWPAS